MVNMFATLPLQAGLCDLITGDVTVFLSLMILIAGAIGAMSTKLSVAAFGAFLVFAKIGMETDIFIFRGALYLSLGLLLVIMGLRIWGFSTGGDETV